MYSPYLRHLLFPHRVPFGKIRLLSMRMAGVAMSVIEGSSSAPTMIAVVSTASISASLVVVDDVATTPPPSATEAVTVVVALVVRHFLDKLGRLFH